MSSGQAGDDDTVEDAGRTVMAPGGDVLLVPDAEGTWSGEGPAGRGRGDVETVLRACARDPDPEWVATVSTALEHEAARGHGDGRAALLVSRGTDEVRFHVTRSANRESVLRHGLDPRRMTLPGIAGNPEPEWDGVFLGDEGEESWFRTFVEEETDVWAVDVRGLWLVSDPSSSGGRDDRWVIVPGRVPPERLALVAAGGDAGRGGDVDDQADTAELVAGSYELFVGEPDPGEWGPRPMASEVDPRLVQRLAVFRRPRRHDDALPPDAARMLGDSGLGANPALARKARDAPDGSPLFLVPGTDAIHLVGRGGSGSGDDIDHALTGEGIGFEDCVGPRGGRILGLLPDDASDVTVTLADGAVVPLAVEGNVYAYDFLREARAVPQRVDLRLGGVSVRLDPPIPDDFVRTRCGPPGWHEAR
ncbi:hypothetical protein [Patulibacter americanus]|uniref:hypothetical protein n=1 Tax=Patulibacter americanus TaxID=588672 RepID=UPI000404AE44|nr:hypothetical protein [Patulibacter americanus]